MNSFNAMVTEANGRLGFHFVRALALLPHPPERIIATYTKEEDLEDLINIKESPGKSQIVRIKIGSNLPGDIDDAIAKVQNAVRDGGLDLVINIIPFIGNEKDETPAETLEELFQTYAVRPILLLKTILPLLEARIQQKSKSNGHSIFFNIIEDNSVDTKPLFEINKVALNLSLKVIEEELQENLVQIFSLCINTDSRNRDGTESKIEHTVMLLLHQIFSLFQSKEKNIESSE